MDHITVLKSARGILEDPKKWAKEDYAFDRHGRSVGAGDSTATCFCAVGAIRRASLDAGFGSNASLTAQDYLRLAMSGNIIRANDADDTKHIEVLMAFDFAILMAEGDAAGA